MKVGIGEYIEIDDTTIVKKSYYYPKSYEELLNTSKYIKLGSDYKLKVICDEDKAFYVEQLVINILQLKSKQEDSHDLEKEIDQIFYDMYGFSEKEQKVVKQYLEM